MKKLLSLLCVFALLAVLAGCGGGAGSQAASSVDLGQALYDSRSAEENEYLPIYKLDGDGNWSMFGDGDDQQAASDGDMVLQFMGLEAAWIKEMAVSISFMNVKSYCIAIVRPAEAGDSRVSEALANYIQMQIAAQEHYLEDQYAIAKAAQLYTTADGSFVLVMAENPDNILNSITGAIGK